MTGVRPEDRSRRWLSTEWIDHQAGIASVLPASSSVRVMLDATVIADPLVWPQATTLRGTFLPSRSCSAIGIRRCTASTSPTARACASASQARNSTGLADGRPAAARKPRSCATSKAEASVIGR